MTDSCCTTTKGKLPNDTLESSPKSSFQELVFPEQSPLRVTPSKVHTGVINSKDKDAKTSHWDQVYWPKSWWCLFWNTRKGSRQKQVLMHFVLFSHNQLQCQRVHQFLLLPSKVWCFVLSVVLWAQKKRCQVFWLGKSILWWWCWCWCNSKHISNSQDSCCHRQNLWHDDHWWAWRCWVCTHSFWYIKKKCGLSRAPVFFFCFFWSSKENCPHIRILATDSIASQTAAEEARVILLFIGAFQFANKGCLSHWRQLVLECRPLEVWLLDCKAFLDLMCHLSLALDAGSMFWALLFVMSLRKHLERHQRMSVFLK